MKAATLLLRAIIYILSSIGAATLPEAFPVAFQLG
jgi:hypothetical protein